MDPSTTEICTLSLHDALPISGNRNARTNVKRRLKPWVLPQPMRAQEPERGIYSAATVEMLRCCGINSALRPFSEADRKSTRLNSSHTVISYAVFCLKKKNENQ